MTKDMTCGVHCDEFFVCEAHRKTQGTTKKLTYEDLIHTARTTLQEEYRV